jgi:transketolase
MKSELHLLARNIRAETLKMVTVAKASHVGGALSMADILAVLYGGALRVRPEEPQWDGRDRFILSKGHSTTGLYATLALSGFFPLAELETYGRDGTRLMSHVSAKVPGVEFSTGSLGHGLPFGTGKALAAQRMKKDWRTFVLLSDGELDEGSNWEAILFAGHHGIENLVAVVDYNKIQSLGAIKDVIELEPLADKFRAFGWDVKETNGHDIQGLLDVFDSITFQSGRPSVVIAHTIKGKGVTFMENDLVWHYRNPSAEQLREALNELGVETA